MFNCGFSFLLDSWRIRERSSCRGILFNEDDDHVPSLNDLTSPMTQQETQYSQEVQVVGTRGNRGTKRSKNFSVEEDELFVKDG